MTEFGWLANPSSLTYGTDAANQAQNVQIAYTTFRATAYLMRADYFAAQDIPEGMIFYGLFQGDGVTYKPALAVATRVLLHIDIAASVPAPASDAWQTVLYAPWCDQYPAHRRA